MKLPHAETIAPLRAELRALHPRVELREDAQSDLEELRLREAAMASGYHDTDPLPGRELIRQVIDEIPELADLDETEPPDATPQVRAAIRRAQLERVLAELYPSVERFEALDEQLTDLREQQEEACKAPELEELSALTQTIRGQQLEAARRLVIAHQEKGRLHPIRDGVANAKADIQRALGLLEDDPDPRGRGAFRAARSARDHAIDVLETAAQMEVGVEPPLVPVLPDGMDPRHSARLRRETRGVLTWLEQLFVVVTEREAELTGTVNHAQAQLDEVTRILEEITG